MSTSPSNQDSRETQVLRRPAAVPSLRSSQAMAELTAQSWLDLPVFRGLPSDVLQRLVAVLVPETLPAGSVLMEQDGGGDALFVLEQGTLHVEIRSGKNTALQVELAAPTLVGEMALVTGEPRSATVRAAVECRVLRMQRPVFAQLCRDHPQTAVFLTCLVGERLLENRGIRRVGKYQVVGRLGSGGVATVFEAIHPDLGTSVALKMLSHALVFDSSFAEHFGREGRLVAQLAHDNIVRVLDTEEAYGTRFIVMEKLTGSPLSDLIKRGERMPWPQIRRILIEVAEALDYSHTCGLIHRDIKPANIFITDQMRVKLLDFGIAVQLGMTVDDEGRIVGTPYYMAPEQILGHQLDGRADLYSLGIVAYELCVHELPFAADSVQALFAKHLTEALPDARALEPDLPDDLVAFLTKSTAKAPGDRFANCSEAAEFLRRAGDVHTADPLEMSSISLTYLPSRRAQVQLILRDAAERLRQLRGVHVFASNEVTDESASAAVPCAPGASYPDLSKEFQRSASGSHLALLDAHRDAAPAPGVPSKTVAMPTHGSPRSASSGEGPATPQTD